MPEMSAFSPRKGSAGEGDRDGAGAVVGFGRGGAVGARPCSRPRPSICARVARPRGLISGLPRLFIPASDFHRFSLLAAEPAGLGSRRLSRVRSPLEEKPCPASARAETR